MAPSGLWLCHFVETHHCASPHSLWALLQPIPAPAAWPDTNIIPLWYSEARSSGQGTCLTSRFFLFHCGGKRSWQDPAPRSTRGWRPSGLQHWKSSNGKYHPPPGLRLPTNTAAAAAAAGSNNQSGRQAGQPNSRPTAPDQTREIRSNKRSRVCVGRWRVSLNSEVIGFVLFYL